MTAAILNDTSPHAGGNAAWGPLATAVHTDAARPTDPTWKDNAYVSFWDVTGEIYGAIHVSTSPNDAGSRRARFSIQLGTGQVEIIEELPAGSFASESISFGLDGTIGVDHPDLRVLIGNAPLWVPADYSLNDLIPPLVPGRPLQHFQQACTVRGEIAHAGRTWDLDAIGMRDRTWGFRDESAQWVEYAGLVGVVEDAFLTVIKFLGADGSLRSDGYWTDDAGAVLITDVAFRRNAAAQFVSGTVTLADGRAKVVSMSSRRAGFFVPMGRETDGPAFGTYDDFMTFESDGATGAGFFEQGIIHRVH
ncbi:hypothetical protein MCHIJ_49210 [Mycolicibacterium chitae]|uniref:Uncharacterized protein n=1 Tax=Mycolicibacterium chitae TaxID=1792 RepID=A0A448I9K1_MYCCI|nr:hypothetical protein [Mycolicibacterium chitae]MCV7104451.1 hypothetical protein [Mycolicibacterium chitae]BBZ05484.1 hypothetical protein MCHIJ_49210 [Mycolicibacterium chitae]VEG49098.1 Uncharacterised protein [Mycolicibacterium chitae]